MSLVLLGILNSQAAAAGGVPAYDHLATYTSSTNTFSVTMSSIPQDYTHLQIRHSIATGASGTGIEFRMQFNGDTSANYDINRLYATGAGPYYGSDINSSWGSGGLTINNSTRHGAGVLDILDYTSTSKFKTVRSLTGTSNAVQLDSTLWRSTSAITSVTFSIYGSEYLIKSFGGTSRFSIYGIKAA